MSLGSHSTLFSVENNRSLTLCEDIVSILTEPPAEGGPFCAGVTSCAGPRLSSSGCVATSHEERRWERRLDAAVSESTTQTSLFSPSRNRLTVPIISCGLQRYRMRDSLD